jgi:DnaJ-class molecular chaperone
MMSKCKECNGLGDHSNAALGRGSSHPCPRCGGTGVEPKQKPTGGKAFDALASALVRVPKAEVDQAAKRYRAKRRKKKK